MAPRGRLLVLLLAVVLPVIAFTAGWRRETSAQTADGRRTSASADAEASASQRDWFTMMRQLPAFLVRLGRGGVVILAGDDPVPAPKALANLSAPPRQRAGGPDGSREGRPLGGSALLSVVIPTYKRASFLLRQLPYYMRHPRIDDIVVSDDFQSTDADATRQWLAKDAPALGLSASQIAKVRVVSTPRRLQCMRNKIYSLSLAKNEWVAILDSDNFFDDEYFVPLFEHWRANPDAVRDPSASFQPGYNSLIREAWGAEMFDFRRVVKACKGSTVIANASWHTFFVQCGSQPLLCNFNAVYNRRTGLRAWSWLLDEKTSSIDPFAFDSLLLNWLYVRELGGTMRILSNMTYTHTKHGDNLAAEQEQQSGQWLRDHTLAFQADSKGGVLAYLAGGGYAGVSP